MELVFLVLGVGRQMATQVKGARFVCGALRCEKSGGESPALLPVFGAGCIGKLDQSFGDMETDIKKMQLKS